MRTLATFYLVIAPQEAILDEPSDFLRKAKKIITIGQADTIDTIGDEDRERLLRHPEVASAFQQGCADMIMSEDQILLATIGQE